MSTVNTGACLHYPCLWAMNMGSVYPQQQHFPKIMKPPQSLPLQMAERLLRAQPDSIAIHITDRSIGDRRALT